MESRLLVYLSMSVAILLLTERSCFALYTLSSSSSSKLIHRFSEEAKSFVRASSTNGDISLKPWPKRKSMEYYNLLVGSDLQRQKMKLGAHYKYLFPSQGSNTMSFGNDFGCSLFPFFQVHYSWVDIGTPNVTFLVALDSGSDLLWLPCNCIECAPLSSSYYSSLDRDLSEYNPSRSSTSKHLPCSHELCEFGADCRGPKQPCPYIRKYNTENTSSSGFLVEDMLHLATSYDNTSTSVVHAPVIIGCGRQQSGGYLDGVAPDGLMGLGFGDVSVLSVLAKAGLMRDSFSICFNEDDSGRIFFGDQGVTTQQSTPFLPLDENYVTYLVEVRGLCIGNSCLKQSGFQTQVDSGTSFTFLPSKVYKKVSLEFDRRTKASRVSYEDSPWEYCYKASSQEIMEMSTMTLMFALNNSFVVHNPFFLVYGDGNEGVTGFCLAIQPTEGDFGIIGQNFMTGYRMVFDRENLKLHWSRSKCQDLIVPNHNKPDIPLPTDERQTQHAPAVAPAVAGRTPSKSSASSSPRYKKTQFCMLKFLLLLTFLSVI